MSLDREKIISELGSVMSQLQSANCGCVGNLFNTTPTPGNFPSPQSCGFNNPYYNEWNQMHGGCGHGQEWNQSSAPAGFQQAFGDMGRPATAEPNIQQQATQPPQTYRRHNSASPILNNFVNPAELYANTYNKFYSHVMQPTLKEIHEEMLSENQAIENKPPPSMALPMPPQNVRHPNPQSMPLSQMPSNMVQGGNIPSMSEYQQPNTMTFHQQPEAHAAGLNSNMQRHPQTNISSLMYNQGHIPPVLQAPISSEKRSGLTQDPMHSMRNNALPSYNPNQIINPTAPTRGPLNQALRAALGNPAPTNNTPNVFNNMQPNDFQAYPVAHNQQFKPHERMYANEFQTMQHSPNNMQPMPSNLQAMANSNYMPPTANINMQGVTPSSPMQQLPAHNISATSPNSSTTVPNNNVTYNQMPTGNNNMNTPEYKNMSSFSQNKEMLMPVQHSPDYVANNIIREAFSPGHHYNPQNMHSNYSKPQAVHPGMNTMQQNPPQPSVPVYNTATPNQINYSSTNSGNNNVSSINTPSQNQPNQYNIQTQPPHAMKALKDRLLQNRSSHNNMRISSSHHMPHSKMNAMNNMFSTYQMSSPSKRISTTRLSRQNYQTTNAIGQPIEFIKFTGKYPHSAPEFKSSSPNEHPNTNVATRENETFSAKERQLWQNDNRERIDLRSKSHSDSVSNPFKADATVLNMNNTQAHLDKIAGDASSGLPLVKPLSKGEMRPATGMPDGALGPTADLIKKYSSMNIPIDDSRMGRKKRNGLDDANITFKTGRPSWSIGPPRPTYGRYLTR